MAATEPRTNHQSRVDWWRGQFQRQRKTDLSVTEFCRQLGVSVTTFYYWKKRVHEALANASGRVPAEHPARQVTTAVGTTAANFVPVSILEPAAGAELEIELTNACVVRLKGAIEPPCFRPRSRQPGNSTAPAKEPTNVGRRQGFV